jgi:hypothetical protein
MTIYMFKRNLIQNLSSLQKFYYIHVEGGSVISGMDSNMLFGCIAMDILIFLHTGNFFGHIVKIEKHRGYRNFLKL